MPYAEEASSVKLEDKVLLGYGVNLLIGFIYKIERRCLIDFLFLLFRRFPFCLKGQW